MNPETKIETPFNRFVGAAIDDGLWFALFFYIVSFLPTSVYEDSPEVLGIILIVVASGWLNYFAFAESKWGMTVGKKVMGMRVLAGDGSKATFGACSVRNVMRPIDYLIIGPVMIAKTKRHQRLGDKLADTIVVRERHEYKPPPKTAASEAPQTPAGEDTPLTEREHRPL
jgi:uncharacterized RDD family membrane protein YckC